MLEPTVVNFPTKWKDEVKVALDEKTIKDLFETKVLSKLAYIFFALEIEKAESRNTEKLKIDKEEFCDRWNIKIAECEKAIIDLEHKAAIKTDNPSKFIQLSLI